jgi:hypothetical protein
MPRVTHHPHPAHAHHHTSLYIGIGLLVMVTLFLALTLVPTISIHDNTAVAVPASVTYPDYAQRHPELSVSMFAPVDTTDYYFRQVNITTRTDTDDQTDYFFRHR